MDTNNYSAEMAESKRAARVYRADSGLRVTDVPRFLPVEPDASTTPVVERAPQLEDSADSTAGAVEYSRGTAKHDNRPEQKIASNFDEFFDRIAEDRADVKGRQYICAPLSEGYHDRPDANPGKANWRLKSHALKRRWLPMDFDAIPDAGAFDRLHTALESYKGIVYTTHSHTDDAPRCRVILAQNRATGRDESKALGEAFEYQLMTRIGHAGFNIDQSVYKSEQPVYLPPAKAQVWRLNGGPVDVDRTIDNAPDSTRSKIAQQAGGRNDYMTRMAGMYLNHGVTGDALLDRLRELNTPENLDFTYFENGNESLPDRDILNIVGQSEGWNTNDLTDDTLARRLSEERLLGDWKYVAAWGAWYRWTGTHWEADNKLAYYTTVRNFLSAVAEDREPSKRKELLSKGKVSAVASLSRSNTELATTSDVWDKDRMLLGTPNGTVDLTTGKLRAARREEYITKTTAVAPAETANCPTWFAFLERIFRTNPDVIPFLKRLAGYSLTGRTSEEALIFAIGSGGNGKDTAFETLSHMMGDYAQKAAFSTFLDSGHDQHPTDLAGMRGARLVIASEVDSGKMWNETRIKELTGSRTIRARFMHGDFFEFEQQMTLIVYGNHRPRLKSVDDAWRRRLLMVDFRECIPKHERDPDLKRKLEQELPGILRWAIEGAQEWQEQGLNPPESVRAASEGYLEAQDDIGQFLDAHVTQPNDLPKKDSVASQTLYEVYKVWAEREGMRPLGNREFSNRLEERGLKKEKRAGAHRWVGYTLKAGPREEQQVAPDSPEYDATEF